MSIKDEVEQLLNYRIMLVKKLIKEIDEHDGEVWIRRSAHEGALAETDEQIALLRSVVEECCKAIDLSICKYNSMHYKNDIRSHFDWLLEGE